MSRKSHFFRQKVQRTDGLIHHYSFEETSGLITSDSVGNTDGDIIGGVTLNQSGKVGQCYNYNGTNGKIEFNNNLDIIDTGFTIKVWVNYLDINGTQIIDGGTSVSVKGIRISIQKWFLNNRIVVVFGNGGTIATANQTGYQSPAITVAAGWHQIIVRVNAFEDVDIFLDGVLQGAPTITGTATSWNFVDANYIIGATGSGVYGSHPIDELSVFNEALTDQEITDIYNTELAGNSIL